jgi:UDP-N-acetylglucosamine--N-acetylmuramyl-(pentapeptide) pyrophosphoryl-undecaprenol N-acetylglucosamine transferase
VINGISSTREDVIHYHSSGSREFENMSAELKNCDIEDKENIQVAPYIYDMSLKMAAADVVICRAGAMTLAELSRLGTPAVLIPSPNVTDNHQYKNAKVLADADAAVIIEEKQFDGEIVKNTVEELLFNRERLDRMSKNTLRFYDLETSGRIYSEIKKLVSEKK